MTYKAEIDLGWFNGRPQRRAVGHDFKTPSEALTEARRIHNRHFLRMANAADHTVRLYHNGEFQAIVPITEAA